MGENGSIIKLFFGEDTFLKKGSLPRVPSSQNFRMESILSSPIKPIPFLFCVFNFLEKVSTKTGLTIPEVRESFSESFWAEITEQELNRLYAEPFERVIPKEDQNIGNPKPDRRSYAMNISEVMPNGNVRVIIPIQLRKTGRTRVIVRRENTQAVQNQIPLLKAIANGIQWKQYLDDGVFKSVQKLAKHLGKERAVVSHTLQLAQLSPKIIHLHSSGHCRKTSR